MPVKITAELQDGWKTKKSQQEKRGKVLVVKFYNEKNGKLLFEWAPTHTQLKFIKGVVIPTVEALEQLKKFKKNSDDKNEKIKPECQGWPDDEPKT